MSIAERHIQVTEKYIKSTLVPQLETKCEVDEQVQNDLDDWVVMVTKDSMLRRSKSELRVEKGKEDEFAKGINSLGVSTQVDFLLEHMGTDNATEIMLELLEE